TFVVPSGTEHKPSSPGFSILMFEPRGTSSTGDRHEGEIPEHVDSTTGHALAMSACWACGHPMALHTPFFQSTPFGTTGHDEIPTRRGLTACQMSMNGWPATST